MHEQPRRLTRHANQDAVIQPPGPRPVGALAIRRELQADTLILWLSGTLDRATSALLDRELDAQSGHIARLVVDLTGLEFIDSNGLDTLTRTHKRACDSEQRLSFRLGLHVGQRPLELTRHLRRRSRLTTRRANSSNNEDYIFPRAIALGDVDHQRPLVIDPGAC